MGDGKEAGWNGAVAFGQIGVAAILAQDDPALNGVFFLMQSEQAYLGPNKRAIRLIEVEQLQRGIVSGAFQPAVDKAPCLTLQTTIFQVHRQKSCVGSDVDQAKWLVEFDAVEQHYLVFDDRSVAQMQIAVAFADEALLAALLEQGLQAGDAGFGPVQQGVELLQVCLFGEQRTNLFEVLPHRRDDPLGAVQRMIRSHLRDAQVELGDLLGEGVDVIVRQLTPGLYLCHQLRLWKLAHLQQVFDRLAIPADLRLLDAAGDRQDLEIQFWRHALVQAQLFLAVMFASREVGEIEEAEINRFLHLVGVRSGKDDPGNMGLDDFEAVDRVRVQGRILQCSNQCLAHGHSL